VWTSDDHGEPSSWSPPVEASPRGGSCDDAALALGAGDEVLVAHADYRQGIPSESEFLARSCDGGASWIHDEPRLDVAGLPMGPHSEEVALAPGRGGRVHVVWNNHPDPVGFEGLEYAAMDPPEPARVEAVPLAGCGSAWRLEGIAPTGPCAAPSWQWSMDGAPIAGATGATLVVGIGTPPGIHDVTLAMTCAGVVPCGGMPAPVSLDFEAPADVAGEEIAGLLFVAKAPAGLHLAWQERASAPTGHSVYAGTVPRLSEDFAYDHAPLACRLARLPADAVDLSVDVAMPARGAYYLVAPATCVNEGVVGFSSEPRRLPRPLSPVAPPCGPMP
jgi:hypothetical protein